MKMSCRRPGSALLAALAWPLAAHAQVCNGLPFRAQGAVAATCLAGDAADTPSSIRQYGAAVVRQLPGLSPIGGHHALRFDGAAGSASWDGLPSGAAVREDGHQPGRQPAARVQEPAEDGLYRGVLNGKGKG